MVKKLLGDAVREERLRRNLSQNSLAEQAKISLRTVSDIENYIGNPQLETLYALATYLHISIDAIFSNQKTNPDSTMQQIMAELNSCPEEQKQLVSSGIHKVLLLNLALHFLLETFETLWLHYATGSCCPYFFHSSRYSSLS